MKTLLLILSLALFQLANCQYYYNDIVGAKAFGDRMKDYVTNKVKTVTAVGFDKEGAKTSDFNEYQEINGQKFPFDDKEILSDCLLDR